MASSLPTFSRGLKLVRVGIIATLLLIVAMLAVRILASMADTSDEASSAARNVMYVLLANVLASAVMAFGVVRALPELKRVRMNLTTIAIAAAGFVVATAALAWSYYVLNAFIDSVQSLASALGDDPTLEQVEEATARAEAAAERLEGMDKIAVIRNLGYGAGLYFLVRTIQTSAAINDQLALRDRAASMGRAVMVMVVGELFYQLTWGMGGGGGGVTGLLTLVLVSGYWIWCHVKLQRFLFDAAWFVNEPHNLPTATVVVREGAEPPAARPSQASMGRVSRPSMPSMPKTADAPVPRPSQPAPIIAVPQPTAPTPRAQTASDDGPESDGPRFLR